MRCCLSQRGLHQLSRSSQNARASFMARISLVLARSEHPDETDYLRSEMDKTVLPVDVYGDSLDTVALRGMMFVRDAIKAIGDPGEKTLGIACDFSQKPQAEVKSAGPHIAATP